MVRQDPEVFGISTPHARTDQTNRRPPGSGSRKEPGTLAAMGEFALIAAVTKDQPSRPGTSVGPGDDAAVVEAPDGRVVISVDMLVDGVHFRTDWASGEQIGRRAALASMADIAAMGAAPTSLVVAISAPGGTSTDLILGIGRGLQDAAQEAGAAVVGGDMTRSDTLAIAVTVLGDLRGSHPVLRSGARPGDEVAVIGRLGWAAAGLAVLSRGFRSPAAVVNAYRVPERVRRHLDDRRLGRPAR
jgi:thiamine-monophosphate kinase